MYEHRRIDEVGVPGQGPSVGGDDATQFVDDLDVDRREDPV
jgi:hypothetical protein